MASTWEVEYTDEFGEWFDGLMEEEQNAIFARVRDLSRVGPHLGRPTVDTIQHSNLKELRTGSIRILFVFDPRQCAILLLGGDKEGQWDAWYKRAIPRAEAIYAEYLEELRLEGLLKET